MDAYLPAGPLREPLAAGAARCQAAVLIGPEIALPPTLPVLRANLVAGSEIADLAGQVVLAFAGIAVPEKFFSMLAAAGINLVGTVPFPDHHPYSEREIRRLLAQANGAVLVTTPKDAVRLPQAVCDMIHVVGVALSWRQPAAIEALLDQLG